MICYVKKHVFCYGTKVELVSRAGSRGYQRERRFTKFYAFLTTVLF